MLIQQSHSEFWVSVPDTKSSLIPSLVEEVHSKGGTYLVFEGKRINVKMAMLFKLNYQKYNSEAEKLMYEYLYLNNEAKKTLFLKRVYRLVRASAEAMCQFNEFIDAKHSDLKTPALIEKSPELNSYWIERYKKMHTYLLSQKNTNL